MGSSHFATWPVVTYGVILLGSGMAYFLLAHLLVCHHGRDSTLAKAMKTDFKGKISIVLYAGALPLAFVHPGIACGLYCLVALMWLVPDRRIEMTISQNPSSQHPSSQ